MIRPSLKRHATAALSPREHLLEAWVNVVGHWKTNQHVLVDRTFGENLLIFCTDGCGTYRLGTVTHPIAAGDIFFVPRGQSHGYASDPRAGWDIRWLHFNGAYVERLAQLAGFTVADPVRRIGRAPAVKAVFSTLLRLAGARSGMRELNLSGALIRLFFELMKVPGPAAPGRDETRLLALVTEDCPNLDSLARKAGYSKYHFCRLFKAAAGVSPWEYAMDLKLGRARELLLGTRLSVKEIAARLGFADPNYFSRRFARRTGLPPRAYRGRTAAG